MEQRIPATAGDPRVLRLTPGQRRAVAALLTQVARVLSRSELLLRSPLDEPLRFAQLQEDLPPAQRSALRQTIGDLTRAANALADAIAATPQVTPVRALLASEFTLLWSDALDTRPEQLSNYGQLAPEAAALLGPHIETLARLSLRAAQLASGEPRSPDSASDNAPGAGR